MLNRLTKKKQDGSSVNYEDIDSGVNKDVAVDESSMFDRLYLNTMMQVWTIK